MSDTTRTFFHNIRQYMRWYWQHDLAEVFEGFGKVCGGLFNFFATLRAGDVLQAELGCVRIVLEPSNQAHSQAFFDTQMLRIVGVASKRAGGTAFQCAHVLREACQSDTSILMSKHFAVQIPSHFPRRDGTGFKAGRPPTIAFQNQSFWLAFQINIICPNIHG